MYASLLFFAQAAGMAVTNTPVAPTVIVLPPQSVPPAAMQPQHIIRGPRETGPPARYVSPDDYPAAALGTGAHGIVRFTLTIGPDGRVIGCAITRSSGSAALDAATCNIIRRRARYTPAMDSNGNPAVGSIEQEIEWKAPQR